MAWQLFGYSIGKSPDVTKVENPSQPVLVLPQKDIDEGAITITQGSYYGTYVDLEGSVRNELELITRYREMSLHPECSEAIEEIVTEAITQDEDGTIVDINLSQLQVSDAIKKKIQSAFDKIKTMLSFRELGEDIFKRWSKTGSQAMTPTSRNIKPVQMRHIIGFLQHRHLDAMTFRCFDGDLITRVSASHYAHPWVGGQDSLQSFSRFGSPIRHADLSRVL